MTFKGTIRIEKEEDWYVATCFENNIASQGKTVDEAMENLKEAISLYYEDGTNKEELSSIKEEPVFITRLEQIQKLYYY